ncbi:baseplate J/gp47 family protein [Undibacterium sp. MH2W]|uniref:baseplate J/gp47 family protein n=1 Tax=Undibacterium sp. MH2W TaxID=3413044 RepID=UPI003BEFE403
MSDIQQALGGADPLLRFSNLNITGKAQAGLVHLLYGYLDWIAKQAVPFTCSDEFLEGWAALKNVFREPATSASGTIMFNATSNALLPAGSVVVRGDGATCVTLTDATPTNGTIVVGAQMTSDPAGVAGAFGNTPVGVTMTLSQSIVGIQSSGIVTQAFTGGNDIESDDSLRSRMLTEYQNQPHGGDQNDYVTWALNVPGVTRAWCKPNGAGAGTVVVYVMFDEVEAAYGGFPQGTNGVSVGDPRAPAATGDQLIVANAILSQQPVTALVYVCAPSANPVSFSITGVPLSARSAVRSAIADVFVRDSTPGCTVPVSHINVAIASVYGVDDFIVSPNQDITCPAGSLPTVGTITWG